ncbi:MAG TPA: hypothetical protein VLI05_01260 [Candidatus Saccharimonadia bacterium]|nr:hypothetical protein [Candidatus Saccharimonadia bacterium]
MTQPSANIPPNDLLPAADCYYDFGDPVADAVARVLLEAAQEAARGSGDKTNGWVGLDKRVLMQRAALISPSGAEGPNRSFGATYTWMRDNGYVSQPHDSSVVSATGQLKSRLAEHNLAQQPEPARPS